MGMEDDVFKLFVSGGSLRLRKTHEAETRYDNWARRGEIWAVRPDDIPHARPKRIGISLQANRAVRGTERGVYKPADRGASGGKNIPIRRHSYGLDAAPR